MDTEHSIERIYTEFREPLKAFISKRIADRSSTEDLLHDVFLKIHNQIDSLKERQKLVPWIYQIARNAITDSFRRQRKVVEPTDDLISTQQPKEKNMAENLIPVVRRMVEDLPEKYKEALLLADFQGLRQAEVAKRFGISLSAAKSRVQRARGMLKALLLECCHFEFDRYGTIFNYRPKKCNNCCDRKEKNERCS